MATAVAGRRAMRLSLLAESLLLFVFRHTRLCLPQERETGGERGANCNMPLCLAKNACDPKNQQLTFLISQTVTTPHHVPADFALLRVAEDWTIR